MNIQENVNYCLSCKTKPCKMGCPLNNDITDAIALFKKGDEKAAYEKFIETTMLPGICGRICPHENQCQGKCVRGIKGEPVHIGEIEAYLADKYLNEEFKKSDELSKYKVAIIGGGPAGLTSAGFLARKGVKVKIFEKHDHLGGIPAHGIPDFRLPRDILNNNIQKILNLGIEYELNKELGKDFTLSDLKKQYDAVVLAIGANVSKKMRIPGEDLKGVMGGNEVLEYNSWPNVEGKNVVISGGGNTAMDVCRETKRRGANVTVIYRRSEKEMPATKVEIKDAMNEGINFMFQTNILKVLGENEVRKLHCIKTELVQKPGENRLSPVNIEGSDFEVDCDYIFMAVGSNPDDKLTKSLGLDLTKWSSIAHDEKSMTSLKGVFVAGDIGDNKATVAYASRSGRDVAASIIEFLTEGE